MRPDYLPATAGASYELGYTHAGGNWRRVRFDSLAEACDAALLPVPWVNRAQAETFARAEAQDGYSLRWLGVDGGAPAVMRALVEGHRPGLAMVEDMLRQLPDALRPPMGRRHRPAWGDTGDAVDMQRVYAGTLDRAFRGMRHAAVRAPRVVRLLVPCNAPSKTHASTMAWRGVAAAAMCQRLTQAGYAVEIVGCFTAENVYPNRPFPNAHIEVDLKSAHAPLDLLTLSGALTVAGFSRYVSFMLRAHCRDDLNPGLGQPVPPQHTPCAGDAVSGFEACTNATSAAAFINAKLAQVGALDELRAA